MDMSFEGNRLKLSDNNGSSHTYSALWLRESSFSPEFRDAKTGHKLGDGDALPLDIKINSAVLENDGLSLEFSDGHTCEYSVSWLADAAEHPTYQELTGEKMLWDASLDPLPWYELRDLEENKAVPPEEAYDLSMTPRALEPHTDNPYHNPQPGDVLLHCIENTANGGESGITDGFRAAEELRNESHGLFDALVNTPVNWFYRDDQAILEDTSTFIDVDGDGSVKHVRFHGRSDRVAAVDADQVDKFYAARRRFIQLIRSATSPKTNVRKIVMRWMAPAPGIQVP